MAEADIEYMDIQDFIDRGYLHEINRLLLHPLGLALSLSPQGGDTAIAQIWDDRKDGEGWTLGEDLLSPEKAEYVADEMFARRAARRERTGFVVQPVETERPTLTTSYINPAERTPRNLAPTPCERCGNPLGFGGHGPGSCIDRREQR